MQAGNALAGFDANISSSHTVADDFTVPTGSTWNLTKFTCYAYADGYDGANSPFNDIRIRIYDTDPSVGNPTPVFGDLATNRLLSTYTFFSYRILNGASSLNKQLWKIEAGIPVTLNAGTYWIEWQIGSTLPDSYVSGSSVAGTVTQPGNNAKTNALPNTWSNLVDGSNAQDLPFRIDYNTGPCSGTPAPGNTLTSLSSVCPYIAAVLSVQTPPEGSGITYQWQSSTDGINYTDIFMGNNDIYYGGSGNQYYRANVGCEGNHAFSNPVFITAIPSIQCYCMPDIISDCSAGNAITNVSTGTLNNASGCGTNGYTNYGLDGSVAVPVFAPGSVVPIAVTVDNNASSKVVGVWVDDGHNGFYDNDYSYIGTTTGGTVTGTIGIPADAPWGLTKMRVRAIPNGLNNGTDVCTGYNLGETEDYIVDINPSTVPCSGVPAPGNTVSTVNPICTNGQYQVSVQNPGNGYGMTYQWQHSIDGITYYDLAGATGSTSSALAFYSSTYFRCIVGCGTDTASSTPLLIVVNPPTDCYCIPAASDCSGGNAISNVTLGTLNNNSGCSAGGYTNYSSTGSINIPDIQVGTPIPITISGGTPGAKIAVWIDYDHNGVFWGASEYTFIGTATGSPITANINVPATGYEGPTRMRVRIESGETMNDGYACFGYTNGETEDYMVNIVGCTTTITVQPQHAILCEGTDHTFSVAATGAGLTYQWQLSTNGCGGAYTDITGATSADYTITNYSASQNYYAYRCIITGACGSAISNCAVTELSIQPVFALQPSNVTACEGGTALFSTIVWGQPVTHQWQVNTGSGWVDLPGDTTLNLTISPVTSAMNGNQYQMLAFGCAPASIVSNTVTLTVSTSPVIAQQPVSVSACDGSWAYFIVNPGGIGYTYQWQVNTGAGWIDIPGATSDSLYIYPVTTAFNGNQYHVIISGTGCAGATISENVILTVTAAPLITTQPEDAIVCEGSIATFSTIVTGSGLSYQWQVSTDGGISFNDIPSSNSPTLSTQPVTLSMNHYRYRVNIYGDCPMVIISDTAQLLIDTIPFVITQPVNASTCLGGTATFTVNAGGINVFYQWEYSAVNCSGPYVDIPGATAATLVTGPVTNTGYYRCKITNSCTGLIYSDCATLTVSSGIDINTQPADQNVCAGNDAVFSVLTGTSGVNYQWQVSIAGGSFTNMPGETNSTLIIPSVTVASSGNQYQVLISSTGCPGTVTSTPATLTVNEAIGFAPEPGTIWVCPAQAGIFNNIITGSNLSFQWQLSTDGGNIYNPIPGATNASYTTDPATLAMSGYLYQLTITGGCGDTLVMAPDTLRLNYPAYFQIQPVAATVCAGNGNTFSGVAYGYNLTTQWQVSSSGCGGSFVDIPGETGYQLALTNISASQDNYAYRNVATDGCGTVVNSDCVVLHVNGSIGITTQPESLNLCGGSYAHFFVVTGVTGITYQWQVSVAGGAFTNMPGETNPELTVPSITAAMDGNQYRAVLTSVDCPNSTISDIATLTVYGAIEITSQPQSQQACYGDAVTLNIAVTGTDIAYRWLVSTDGGNLFYLIPGATGPSYTTDPLVANQYKFMVYLNGICQFVQSAEATITVNPQQYVSIVANPSNTSLLPGQSTVLSASAAGATSLEWKKDNVVISGATGSTLTVSAGEPGAYNVTATNAWGCSATSNIINVTDSILDGGRFSLFSNPSDGRFTINYPNLPSNSSVAIFDNHGSRSMLKSNLGGNQLIQVDMRHAASGIYTVIVYNASGKRLATGKIMIIH